MSYGYSDDLRIAALSYYDRWHKQLEVCDIFGISRRTLCHWLRLRESGDYRRRINQKPKPPTKIDDQQLVAYIQQNPDAYLREIGEHFNVAPSTIFKACKRLDLTRKKNKTISGTRRKIA